MAKKSKAKSNKIKARKCSHVRGDKCPYCTVTQGDNYKCSIFDPEEKKSDSLHDSFEK